MKQSSLETYLPKKYPYHSSKNENLTSSEVKKKEKKIFDEEFSNILEEGENNKDNT